MEPAQSMHLLRTTHDQNVRGLRSTGMERAVLYLLAGLTGPRRKELLHLSWGGTHLSEGDAFVRVPAKLGKDSRTAEQPVTLAPVTILQALKDQKTPKRTDRVFVCQTPPKTIQKLARHAGPKLTFNVYARSLKPYESRAVKQLPDVADFAGQF